MNAPSMKTPKCPTVRSQWCTLRKLASLCALVLIIGCDSTDTVEQVSVSKNNDSSFSIRLGVPNGMTSTRERNLDFLVLRITLDGEPVNSTRNGDVWNADFDLPGADTYGLRVTWLVTLQNGSTLTVANTTPQPISENSRRTIRINDYNINFDEDEDGLLNLDEFNLGMNLLVAELPQPNDDQTDCAAASSSLTDYPPFFESNTAPQVAPFVNLARAQQLTPLYLLSEDLLSGFGAYWVLVPGELTLTHQQGGPGATGSLLYDTDTSGALRRLDLNQPFDANGQLVADMRSVVSAQLDPGIYCFRIESGRRNDPIREAIVALTFTPDP